MRKHPSESSPMSHVRGGISVSQPVLKMGNAPEWARLVANIAHLRESHEEKKKQLK